LLSGPKNAKTLSNKPTIRGNSLAACSQAPLPMDNCHWHPAHPLSPWQQQQIMKIEGQMVLGMAKNSISESEKMKDT